MRDSLWMLTRMAKWRLSLGETMHIIVILHTMNFHIFHGAIKPGNTASNISFPAVSSIMVVHRQDSNIYYFFLFKEETRSSITRKSFNSQLIPRDVHSYAYHCILIFW